MVVCYFKNKKIIYIQPQLLEVYAEFRVGYETKYCFPKRSLQSVSLRLSNYDFNPILLTARVVYTRFTHLNKWEKIEMARTKNRTEKNKWTQIRENL